MKEILGITLYDLDDVGGLLNCNIRTIQTYIKKELLRAVTISGKIYISETSLRIFLNCGYEFNPIPEPETLPEPEIIETSDSRIVEVNKLISKYTPGTKRPDDNKYAIGKIYTQLIQTKLTRADIQKLVKLSPRQLSEYAKAYKNSLTDRK